jgi:hypothetical protein
MENQTIIKLSHVEWCDATDEISGIRRRFNSGFLNILTRKLQENGVLCFFKKK